ERALVVLDGAAAAAGRAHDRGRARGRTAPVTGVARHLAGEVDGGRDAVDGIEERQVQLGLEIVASARSDRLAASAATHATPTAEEVAEQVAEATHVAHVLGGEGEAPAARSARAEAGPTGTESAGHGAETADLVVGLALLVVGEDVVGGGDLLEALLVAGVGVGVMLLGQLA